MIVIDATIKVITTTLEFIAVSAGKDAPQVAAFTRSQIPAFEALGVYVDEHPYESLGILVAGMAALAVAGPALGAVEAETLLASAIARALPTIPVQTLNNFVSLAVGGFVAEGAGNVYTGLRSVLDVVVSYFGGTVVSTGNKLSFEFDADTKPGLIDNTGSVGFEFNTGSSNNFEVNPDGSFTYNYGDDLEFGVPGDTSVIFDDNGNYEFARPGGREVIFNPFTGDFTLGDGAQLFPNGGTIDLGPYIFDFSSSFERNQIDPIVLDLSAGGTGVELIGLDDSDASFDLIGNGFATHTGWVGATTGLLVQDTNSNGVVDNITELFGNSTTDGFTALKAIDDNHDNIIDTLDSAFASLKVWTDTDGDGATDAGELHTLSELNITSINISSTPHNENVNGNTLGAIASFMRGDGSTAQVAEAYFDNSRLESTFTGEYTLNPEVLLLPNLRGYGLMPDLYIAMSMDSTLLTMVSNFANQTSVDFARAS